MSPQRERHPELMENEIDLGIYQLSMRLINYGCIYDIVVENAAIL